ncbi:MAG: mannose-6-phosphate isomerase, class I [Polyangiaceae bacterium]|nr:mannose-6-phosphate isomerase, class I [Polyangiaceae bacterium]
MYRLENPIKDYAWGSRTAIAELTGRAAPAPRPEAELWMGAHPSTPSRIDVRGGQEPLDVFIARDPSSAVGARVIERYGPRLPFLLKVLAAAAPLSLQAHPSTAQAAAGFAAENALGIPLDAPCRNYRDPSHKPELIAALGPFRALCGFRSVEVTARLLRELAVTELAGVERALANSPGSAGLRAAFEELLDLDPSSRAALVTATTAACGKVLERGGPFAPECAMAVALAARYPGDVGVVSALLLNLVVLRPDEAIYLPAGNLHAYLEGVGVEIMASSDNVLRGGLTPKHVDVPELCRVLDFNPIEPTPILPVTEGPELVYPTPAAEFRLSRIDVTGRGCSLTTTGPEILLTTSGTVVARNSRAAVELPRGAAAFVPAETGGYSLAGSGSLFRATVPDEPP